MSYLTDPANVYFNASYTNNTRENIVAEYTSYRNTIIVNNPSEYYMKIQNFYASDLLIPLMIVDATSLSVTIDATSTGGVIFKQYVPVINNSSLTSSFGFIYDPQVFVEMVNRALVLAHAGSGALGNAPILSYASTGIMSFFIDQVYRVNGTEIWFNNNLGQKLSSFVLYFNSFANEFPPINDGRVYRLVYYPTPTNTLNNFPPTLGYPIYKVDQPYPSTFLLADVNRLFITTSQMPCLREYITANDTSGATVTFGILFSLPLNDSFESNSQKISFDTYGFGRLIDMPSQDPLNVIDYRIYFQTVSGRYYPVYIEPGKGFNITFLFVHKSIYDNAYTFNKLDL